MRYQDINADTIDRWVKEGWEWGKPISHEQYIMAQQGNWNVLLTPTKHVPHSWFGDLKGKKLLGLASGGGQQMPLFAACGAICTVMDYSPVQLQQESMCAKRDGYDIQIIRGDMTERFPFDDESFNLIFHPVSNCYIQDVQHVWDECFRVLKPGGILLAGFDYFINFVLDDAEEKIIRSLPFNPLLDPELMEEMKRTDMGVQFSHTLQEQLGGQLKAGFMLKDLYEDTNGSGNLHDHNIPSYMATRAIKL